MTFVKGEFLHVIGKPDDGFYLAYDPVSKSKGLVPMSYFEVVHKNEAAAAASQATESGPRFPSAGHDSGYAENVHTHRNSDQQSSPAVMAPAPLRMSNQKSSSSSCFYGTLLYDFAPERPDELMASEGETVLIVAVSNDQWVVAKPIHRLGGPGLVPFNHIHVIDMKTGAVIAEPYRVLVDAGVPSAEQWKIMASGYENRSIPLGVVDSMSTAPANAALNRTSGNISKRQDQNLPSIPPAASQQRHTPTNSITSRGTSASLPPPPQSQQKPRVVAVKYRIEGLEGDIFVVRISSAATYADFIDKIAKSRQSHMPNEAICYTDFAVTYTNAYTQAEDVINNQWGLARYFELAERPVLYLRGNA